jgi:hypothetical protein
MSVTCSVKRNKEPPTNNNVNNCYVHYNTMLDEELPLLARCAYNEMNSVAYQFRTSVPKKVVTTYLNRI